MSKGQHCRHPGEGGEGEGSADRVDGEPAEAGHHGVERAGQDVPAAAEGRAPDDHLGEPLARAPGGEDALGERAERCAEGEGEHRLPEAEAEDGDREDSDEDGRELEVRGRPGRQQLPGRPVTPLGGDRLDATGLDGCGAGAGSGGGCGVCRRGVGHVGTIGSTGPSGEPAPPISQDVYKGGRARGAHALRTPPSVSRPARSRS